MFLFDVWQFPTLAWGDPTLPSALRRFTSEFGMGSGGTTALLPPDKFFSNLPNFNLKSGADTQSRTGDLTLTKGALYQLSHISTLNLMPGSSLLSHGETPTLPSALRRFTSEFGMGVRWDHRATAAGANSVFIRPLLRSDLICIRLKIFSHPPKQLRRCKVKPHGSLVPVSSTHRCAYTPGLSTSSSSTFLQDSQGVRENSSRGQVSCLDAFSTYLFRI